MFNFPKGGWRQTKRGAFSGNCRDGGELIVIPSGTYAGRWVLMGGWYSGPNNAPDPHPVTSWYDPDGPEKEPEPSYIDFTNDILTSDDDGATWSSTGHVHNPDQAGGSALWYPSHFVPTVLHTYSGTTYIYRIGDDQHSRNANGSDSPVWRSPISSGGTSGWSKITTSGPTKLSGTDVEDTIVHRAVSFNGYLYVVGGQMDLSDKDTAHSRVWRSADGITWTKLSDGGFDARGAHGLCVHSHGGTEYLYLACGKKFDGTPGDEVYYNDVWRMTAGETWSQVLTSGSSPFCPRSYANLRSAGGRLWLFGGALPDTHGSAVVSEQGTAAYGDGDNLKSVWYSTDGGSNWRRAADLAWDGSHADGMFSDGDRIYRVSGNRFDKDAYIIHR